MNGNASRRAFLERMAAFTVGATLDAPDASAQPQTSNPPLEGAMLIASPSNGDQGSELQALIDECTRRGGGVVQLAAGTFTTDQPLVLKPNVILRGAGMDVTVLKVGVDDISLLSRHREALSGIGGIEDLTVHGYADRNGTLGKNKLVSIGPFDRVWFHRIKAIYSRNMSLTATGYSAEVINCLVHKSHRDGINLTNCDHVRIVGNDIEECGDDAIAVHIGSQNDRLIDRSIIITENRISKSFGIKCLGARNAVIANNVIRFWYAYGINVGIDEKFGEGLATKFNVVVSGNVVSDGMSGRVVGSGDLASAILFSGDRSSGSGQSLTAAPVGDYNPPKGAFVGPGPYLHKGGPANPRGADFSVTINGNSIVQTLEGMTKFSDAGFGLLWKTKGPIDPLVSSLVRGVDGIDVRGDFENLVVTANSLHGVRNAIRFKGFAVLQGVSVTSNVIRRSRNGVVLADPQRESVDLEIADNDFDLDPLHESPDRTRPLDGSWKTLGGADWIAIATASTRGVFIERNRFRHCKRALLSASDVLYVRDNRFFWDWSGARPAGIGEAVSGDDNLHFFVHCDPALPNYGEYDSAPDGAFQRRGAGMPSSGYYRKNQFVLNAQAAISEGRLLIGWLRLTSGNGHAPDRDWAPIYVQTS